MPVADTAEMVDIAVTADRVREMLLEAMVNLRRVDRIAVVPVGTTGGAAHRPAVAEGAQPMVEAEAAVVDRKAEAPADTRVVADGVPLATVRAAAITAETKAKLQPKTPSTDGVSFF